jgi:hypothetical protein
MVMSGMLTSTAPFGRMLAAMLIIKSRALLAGRRMLGAVEMDRYIIFRYVYCMR